jgi:hypothetical protein
VLRLAALLTLAIEWRFAIPHVVRWDIERPIAVESRGYGKLAIERTVCQRIEGESKAKNPGFC